MDVFRIIFLVFAILAVLALVSELGWNLTFGARTHRRLVAVIKQQIFDEYGIALRDSAVSKLLSRDDVPSNSLWVNDTDLLTYTRDESRAMLTRTVGGQQEAVGNAGQHVAVGSAGVWRRVNGEIIND